MNIEIQTLIEIYKQEIERLQNENITLRCQLLQIEKDNKKEVAIKEEEK